MKSLVVKWMSVALLIATLVATVVADIKIRRRVVVQDHSYEAIMYLKGARQRKEVRQLSHLPEKPSVVAAFVDQCDLKQLLWIDLTNKRFAVHTNGTPIGAVMAFNELQVPSHLPKKRQRAEELARKKGLLKGTTTVVDTGERREMFGFTARHLKITTVWEASPKTCKSAGMKAETDGWYTDLFYGIDCSADLSGSIARTDLNGTGKCFSEYAVKRGYWLEHKRIGPASLGYPLLEIRTSYDDKGEAEVVTEEVLEVSTATLDPSLFDVPDGFTKVDFKSDNRSFFRRLFSFLGDG